MSDDQSVNDIGRISRSDEVTKRLLTLIDQLGYQLVQENGQRRLTSTTINNCAPRTKGAEIFLGRLPRDCYEDELVPILMKIGRVLELRLMMDFSGSTRGYAFASFETSRIARKACDELNGYEIRPGHKIGVVKSIDNCRLFLGGVPKDKTKADFLNELGKLLDGITNIYVYPSTVDKSLNRGFIFVEFQDHRSAAMARRKLIPGRVMLWDHEVAVDWADPEPGQDVDEEIMETVSALFVRNLSLTATESEIKNIIQRKTRIPIMKIKKINHFAFLHYEHRAQAQHVLQIMNQSCGGGELSEWEFTWAKPIRKSEKLLERLRCSAKSFVKNDENQDDEIACGGAGGVMRDENYRKNESNNKKKTKILGLKGNTKGSLNGNNNNINNNRDRNGSSSSNISSVSSTSTITKENNINENMLYENSNYLMNKNNNNNNNNNNNAEMMNENVILNLNLHDNQGNYYTNNNNYACKSTYAISAEDHYLAQCAAALGELAASRFQADLLYEYWSDPLRTEYFCKIILKRNGCELMNYQGTPASTMHEAISLTVPAAYARMQSMLMNANKFV